MKQNYVSGVPIIMHFLRQITSLDCALKEKIAQIHEISTVTLWRYAKEGSWEFGKNREKLIEEVSEASAQRLLAMRTDIVEEHAIMLSSIREEVMETEDMGKLRRLSKRLYSLLGCIKAERLCLGLPNEIQIQVKQ